MDEQRARSAIVEAGKRMREFGYVVSNDGNISVRLDDGNVLITPSGVSKGQMSEEMMVVLSLDGKTVRQGGRKASSEAKMHLRVYQENPSVGAVVHAHPIYATSFAIAGIALDDPILSEAMVQLGAVPVAHYAEPGTLDVPDSIAPFVRDYGAVLLSNHGALTWGETLEEAEAHMEVLENYAHVSFVVRQLGACRPLSAEQVEGMGRVRARFGLSPVVMPQGAERATNLSDVLPNSASVTAEGSAEVSVEGVCTCC